MLMPDENGYYNCEHDDYRTRNVFSYMDHAGMEFDWMISVSKRYNFNMFTFLAELNFLLSEGMFDDAWNSVQGVSLMFVNSTGEDFDDFIGEAEVISASGDMFSEIEQYLKEVKHDD